MRPLYTKALRDILGRKLRSLLTVLGIAIGVLGLTAISISQGRVSSAFQYAQDASALPDITYFTSPASASLAHELSRQPNVKVVQTADEFLTRWQVPTGRKSLQIIAFPDPGHNRLYTFELVSGSLPGPNQVLMESSNGTMSPVTAGDRVTIQVNGTPRTLTVSGLVRTRGRPSSSFVGMALAYARVSDMQRIFHTRGINYFGIGLSDYGKREATAKALAPIFAAHGATILGVTVGHDTTLEQISTGVLGTLQVLSFIALLLSIILLLSTITTLVAEQTRSIGTMKAIGATRGAVMRTYLMSVAVYAIVGTLLGFGLGILAARWMQVFIGSTFTLDPRPLSVGTGTVVLAIVIGIGVPLLAAVVPVYLGTRVTVHEALAGYGLQQGSHGNRWMRVTRPLLAHLPRTMLLGARSLFRRRTRALLTLLALSVAAASFMAVQTTSYSFSTWIGHVFDTYRADVFVTLVKPVPYSDVQRIIARTPGIEAVERSSQAVVTTRWGSALLTGAEPNATLYGKKLVSGRWFRPGDHDVAVISTQGADVTQLRVGDTIGVRDQLHAAGWHIIGVATDDNGLAQKVGVVLVPLSQMNLFRGLPADMTDGFMVRATSRSEAAIRKLSTRLDDSLAAAGMQANVTTAREQSDRATGQINIINLLLYAVALIVALVGAIGLFNTLAMSVLERRREIGILRSMGASGRKVASVFWTEGLTVAILSWLVGVVIGIPAAYGFVRILQTLLMPVPFSFSPFGPIYMLLFIVVVATGASVIPAWAASRMRIAETLRYEG